MKNLFKSIFSFILLESFNLLYNYFLIGAVAFTPFSSFNAPSLYYDMNHSYGVTRRPNAEIAKSYPWSTIKFKTNSKGFRDDEFKNGDILITGNSFIEGFGIKKEKRFSELLEAKSKKVKIANAGSAGVWSAIQSLVAIKDLNNDTIKYSKNIIILTPSEISRIGKRSPLNDSRRNFPYKKADSIAFFNSNNSVFNKNLSFVDKTKRVFKYSGTYRIYSFFNGYGSGKRNYNLIDFDIKNLDWYFQKLEELDIKSPVEVILLNGLSNTYVNNIEKYKIKNKNISFKVIRFDYSSSDYFISNGHLNSIGNKKFAEILQPHL